MIKKTTIKNRQSHLNTELEFHPYVNVIIGTSAVGKSSVLRSFDWIFNNRPLGQKFSSYWIRDGKKLKGEILSSVHVDDKVISRIRSQDRNLYTVKIGDGEEHELEAPGTSVPEEITDILNVNEVNFQKQRDRAFLIEDGPTEAAKFLNKTVKLDLIGDVLGRGENKRIRLNREINSLEESITKTTEDLNGLNWIEDVERKLELYDRRESRLNELKDNYAKLQKIHDDIIEAQLVIDSFPDFTNVDSLISEYEMVDNAISNGQGIVQLLENAILYDTMISEVSIPDNIDTLIDEYWVLSEEVDNKTAAIKLMETALDLNSRIAVMRGEIENLTSSIPDVCPTCGQPVRQ